MKNVFFLIVMIGVLCVRYTELYADSNFFPLTIDVQDSVNLNLSEATLTDNIITIPMYIDSDDDINSLDFSLVFDTEKLTYLSIIDHTDHIQFTEFFNPQDQTLRFTSNSFTLYAINKKIISIRFKVTAPCIETKDFFTLISYLNGDLCSSKIPRDKICATSASDENTGLQIKVFPNPASKQLFIISPEKAIITLTSSDGKRVKTESGLQADKLFTLNTEDLPSGTYYLHFTSEKINTNKSVIIKNE